MEYTPIVVAHRGLWFGQFMENSRAAFEAAAKAGFPAECDVWKSAEGEPVVIHDPTLDRTTCGRGPVSDHSASDLNRLGVPILSDVADLVHFVEIKPDNDNDLVARVIDRMHGRRWLLQSFDCRNLHHAARIEPAVPLALLIDDTSRIEQALEFGWSVHADHKLVHESISGRVREKGLKLGVWTVNTEPDLLRLLHFRPDVIISDSPRLIADVLHRLGFQATTSRDWRTCPTPGTPGEGWGRGSPD